MIVQPLARRTVRLAAVAALQAIPGVTVKSPGTLASQPASLPELLVRCGDEGKQQLAKSQPNFTTSVTVVIDGRAEGSTPEAAQDAIEALGAQVEAALLSNLAFVRLAQALPRINSRTTIDSSTGRHLASLLLVLSVEVAEFFDPLAIDPSQAATLTTLDIHADLRGPADPAGTYTGAPWPAAVTPAPRTAGPDGRDEGRVVITLPT